MIRIEIDDAAALRALSLDMDALAKQIALAVGKEDVLPRAIKYPGQRRRPQPFVSPQQRRAFFAGLKSGRITVPYQRTGALSASWTVTPTGDGAEVSASAPYATLVVGEKGEQAHYHRGNWPNVEQIAAEAEGDAEATATGVVVAAIANAGGAP